MNRIYINILAVVAMAFAVSAVSAAELQVYANVDTSRDIYTGESFTYQIIIDGYDQPGEVNIEPLAAYNPRSAGGGNASQTSVSIINGRTTTNAVKRYIMNYSLTAGRAGLLQIPPVDVAVDGKTYRTNPVELNVIKPGTTDQLELEVTLSEQKCYVGQPVILTVKFYIYADIGDYQFDIPALNSDAFIVEDLEGEAGKAKQYRVTRRNREAILLTSSKVLIPKLTGDIDLGSSSVSADVAVGRARSRDRFFNDFFGSNVQYKRFSVSSEPANLTVLPLPEQGRPDDFYGLVGRYTISASATPTEVSVGDPITLAIKIGGEYLKQVQWPRLEQIKRFAENFKIPSQKASPAVEGNSKVFTQTIRATNEKVAEIPSIPLAFFDVDKGRYVVANTEPIKLDVSPTKILTTADVEGRDFSPVSREVEAVKRGISANYEGLDCLEDVGFSLATAAVRPVYLAGWALPLVVLVAGGLGKALVHTSPQRAAQKRIRGAAGKAINRLRKIKSSQAQSRYVSLAEAMKQYIGERFDKVAGSLTADDCRNIIMKATANSELAGRYRDIIDVCEAGRYAPVRLQIDSAKVDEVIKLIRSVNKSSK